MLKKLFIHENPVKQGILSIMLFSCVSFGLANAEEPKECKNEADKKAGCVVIDDHDNGTITITPYKNGKMEGVEKHYDGESLWRETSYKNDKKEYEKQYAFSDGNSPYLQTETPYNNDKKHGIEKWYYENGDLKQEVSYVNGEIHGNITFYDKEQNIFWQANAEHGKIASGKCGNDKPFTRAQIIKLNNMMFEDHEEYLEKVCEWRW